MTDTDLSIIKEQVAAIAARVDRLERDLNLTTSLAQSISQHLRALQNYLDTIVEMNRWMKAPKFGDKSIGGSGDLN
jgi:hypothetical protein